MEPTLALLPSPLLGPSVWQRVAAELKSNGWSVTTVPISPTAPRTPEDVLQTFLLAVPADRDVILVPHSNAGLYVPSLVRRGRVVGAVFVDAGLPPREGDVPLAPPAFFASLAGKADADGLLPPWTSWWDEADVAELFPNAAVRERVEREQSRLPLSYFAASLSVPLGWDDGLRGAYLAFGDTYGEDLESAADRGWPTTTMPARHLHTLMDPAAVASELQTLLSTIGFPAADE